jgi:AraC-like DNA-binding protein
MHIGCGESLPADPPIAAFHLLYEAQGIVSDVFAFDRDHRVCQFGAAQHLVSYHLITAGGCWAVPTQSEPVWLDVGDIVVFPAGDAHVMCSDPKVTPGAGFDIRRIRPAEQWPYRIVGEKGGPNRLGLVCGFLGCDVRPFNPLLAALPNIMVVRGSPTSNANDGWLSQFMHLAVAEATDKRAGGEGMLARLSELMFVEAVRRHLDTLPTEQTGWLAGLRDRFVGRALTLLHSRPAHHWTLEELAHEVGLARSSFAERFLLFVGQPPMQYLTHWRMQVASRLLRGSVGSIAAIAEHVGYESEAAFSRAFKNVVGVPPGTWRRQPRATRQAN